LSDLGDTIFSYILPGNREGLDYALQRLELDHFDTESRAVSEGHRKSDIHKVFWSILLDYADRYGEVFDKRHLASLLRNSKVDPKRLILYVEHYHEYCREEVPQHAFEYAVDGLIQERHRKLTGDAIADSWKIFQDGLEINGVTLQGDTAARDYLSGQLSDLDSVLADEAPEGDMRGDIDRILADYQTRRDNPDQAHGVSLGIDFLDEYTDGLQPGDFCLIAGFTSHGKSQFCAQLAWHTAVIEKKATFFATSETVRDVTMHRILARHSRLPKFGLPHGLDLNRILRGTLTTEEHEILHAVGMDFMETAELLHICQMPSSPTMAYIERRAKAVDKKVPLDLLIMDELRLVHSEGKHQGERERSNEVLRRGKTMAVGWGKGRGIAFVSPWQMSRDAFDKAKDLGYYQMASLSDTSEAEKVPDLIITILRPDPTSNEALFQILKNRNHPTMEPRPVYVDFRTSFLGSSSSAVPERVQINDALGNESLMSLLPS